jgi:1,5-anhydro-D-fructose reductase (1,5-anhydro-D-mannitol-forming)
VDARSVGFLVAGASHVAAQQMLAAIREQPPVAGTRDVAGAWVAALHSHNERRGREFAQRHAIIHVSTEMDVLLGRSEVQCVYVGNHPRHHAETVQAALAAHKHVLCEPPLALAFEEAEVLVQMARNRGLVLAVNYAWRATGAMHQMAELLLSDSIGELLGGRICNTAYLHAEQQSWRLQPNGGGVVWNRTLHDLDLVRFLLRLPVREVYGRSGHSTLAAGVEDELIGHALLSGGLAIQLYDSFVQAHAPVSVELYGTHGSLAVSHCAPGDAGAELHLRRGDNVRMMPAPAVNPYRAGVANFLAAVRGEAPALAGGADDLHNIAAALAMLRSLQEGVRVRCRTISLS